MVKSRALDSHGSLANFSLKVLSVGAMYIVQNGRLGRHRVGNSKKVKNFYIYNIILASFNNWKLNTTQNSFKKVKKFINSKLSKRANSATFLIKELTTGLF